MSMATDTALDLKRVLVVEDSPVTKDLVELVLTQSGHSVTCVETGQAALDALASDTFDVVLTDFHLPDITGLEIVRRFDASNGDGCRPLFVAITGDTRGLLSDVENCELFDQVVPKPLDIDLVCDLVDAPPAPAVPTRHAPTPRDRADEGLGLALFDWPPRAGPAPVPGLPGIDAIAIREARDLEALWRIRGANLLPVLDATGTLGASADIDISHLTLEQAKDIRRIVERFHERRAELHTDLIRSDEPSERLLARIEVGGGRLEARLSHRHERLVAWNTICDPDAIHDLLDKLSADDLVTTRFFERIHSCPSCRSARLVVREECPSCGSSHLADESYLHHFRCATQAPERDFSRGDDLICPKCNRELRHFGRDYDRPGILTRCESCRGTTVEPQVAFICTRCLVRTPSEAVPTRDVLSADLTETGRTYLRTGGAFFGAGRRALRFGDFPLELVVALNRAAAAYNDRREPFTLAVVHYDGLDEIRELHGALRARESRRLWLEALQQSIGDRIVAARGNASDFVLLTGQDPDAAQPALESASAAAGRTVRDDLRVDLRVFGPEDIAR